MKTSLGKIINLSLIVLICLLPIFFLPLTTNVYFLNKFSLLAGVGLILVALGLVKSLLNKKISWTFSAFDLPVIALAISSLLSTWLRSPNRHLALWGETGMILGLSLLYFLVTQHLGQKRKTVLPALALSGSLLALVTVYQFMGLGQAFFPNTIMEAKNFTPAGSLISLAIFLVATLIVCLRLAWQNQNPLAKTLMFVASGLQLAGLVIAVYQLMPGQPTALRLLPLTAGWSITIDAFKQSPLLGIGPNNFLSAFTQFKPVNLNFGDLWQIRFLQASNYPLQLLATTGLLGLASWIMLLVAFVKRFKKMSQGSYGKTFTWVAGVILITSFLMPLDLITLMALYVCLALMAAARAKKVSYNLPDNQTVNWISLGLTVVVGLAVLYPIYPLGKVWAADYTFRRSFKAIEANDGNAAYNLQLKALELNPQQPSIRMSFSQTNLALAQSLASQENPTDQDQQNIIQLVQQAINEAKNAVALNPQNITLWENLAQIYRNLINFAEGADQWAISALTQAVQLDPTNANLRVQLGGLYYALGDLDTAQRVFEQAISVKADHANAYYNLAVTLQEQNKLQKAALAYQQTLNLLPADSPDRKTVEEKLAPIEAEVKKQLETQQAQQQQTPQITEPEPLPEQPSGFKPIILDEEEAAPPEVSPKATPTPEAETAEETETP